MTGKTLKSIIGNDKDIAYEHVSYIYKLLKQKLINPNQLLLQTLLMIPPGSNVKKCKYYILIIGLALRYGASANAYINIASYSDPIHILAYINKDLSKYWRNDELTKTIVSLLILAESDVALPVFYNKETPIISIYLATTFENSEQTLKYLSHILDKPELLKNSKISLRLSIKYFTSKCMNSALELKLHIPSHQYLIWTLTSFNLNAYQRLIELYESIPYWLTNQILLAIEKNNNHQTYNYYEYINEILINCLKILIDKKVFFDHEQWNFIQRLQLDSQLMNYYYSTINSQPLSKLPTIRIDRQFTTGYLDLATYQDRNGTDWYYLSSELPALRETKINPTTKQELPPYFLDQLRKQQYFNKRLSLLMPCQRLSLDLITSSESDRIVNLLSNILKLYLPAVNSNEFKSLSFKQQIKILTDILGSEKIVKFFQKRFYVLSPKLKFLTFCHLCYQIIKNNRSYVKYFITSYNNISSDANSP